MMLSKIQNTKRQSGLTLIELMLSITIGMFLLLGVTGLFNSTKRSFSLQNNLSALSETARFSVDTITWHTRLAGFRANNWSLGILPNALLVVDGGAAPDSLSVSYDNGAAGVDCNQAPGVGAMFGGGLITIQFQIIDNALVCNNQVLFTDVVDMQIFVGEDTDNDGVVNRFRVQDGTIPSNRIKALNINLLLRTEDTGLSDTTPTLINNFWSVVPGDDGRIYQEYSFNITFRNLI